MKILVPVKRVVDHQLRVRVRPDGSGLETEGLKRVINAFDEIALEEAVRLREAGLASEVLVASCGPAACQENLRNALALGADRAVLLETDECLQPLGVAKLLKALALREAPDLVLMGKLATDDDAGQVGPMLAAMLGWPQACFASKLVLGKAALQVSCEVEGGLEVLELSLPALVTADLRLNEPRFVSLMNLMQARKKPVEVLPASGLGVDFSPRLKTLHYAEPPVRAAGRQVASAGEMAHALRARLAAEGAEA